MSKYWVKYSYKTEGGYTVRDAEFVETEDLEAWWLEMSMSDTTHTLEAITKL